LRPSLLETVAMPDRDFLVCGMFCDLRQRLLLCEKGGQGGLFHQPTPFLIKVFEILGVLPEFYKKKRVLPN
ncbi:MAG: hypothetical protein WA821_17245, partial [Anaerolineales bacterium]